VETLYFETLVSVPLIGVARFIKQFSGFISFWFSGSFINKYGDKTALISSRFYITIIRLSALAINNTITPFLSSLTNLLWGLDQTSFNNLHQKEFSSSQRATMGSIVAFFSNIFGSIVTIFVGYIADITSPRIAIFITVIPTTLVLIIYNKIFSEENYKNTKERAAE
jgi:hypothetical protein